MSDNPLSFGISLYFALSGVCLAATPVAQGTIEFKGAIVEPSCMSRASQRAGFELMGCPTPGYVATMNARRVEPISSVSALDHSRVNVKLLAESGQGVRDQQYQLVDDKGSPVRSGMYLVTLTMP